LTTAEAAGKAPLLKANLKNGPVYRTLLRFTLPYLLSQVLQAMYSTADLMIVGQFSSAVSDLSAVSNGSHIIHVITNVIASFSISSTVLIGQCLGSRQPERVSRAIGVSLSLSSLIALAFSLIAVCFSGLIVRGIQHFFGQYVKQHIFEGSDSNV
jgi:Na+-driven multidrug efflux pump